jgi:hypothetical protein
MGVSFKLEAGLEVPYDYVDFTGQFPAASVGFAGEFSHAVGLLVEQFYLEAAVVQGDSEELLALECLDEFAAADVVDEEVFVGD